MFVYILHVNVCDLGALKHKKFPHKMDLQEKKLKQHKLFHFKGAFSKQLQIRMLVLRCVTLILANVFMITFLAISH